MNPNWLEWSQRLNAIAQIGLTYASGFDIDRYQQIRDLAVEIAERHTDASNEKIHGLFSHDIGYATPKVDARGVMFQGDSILLVKEAVDGLWTLPGGWADIGDSPSEAVEREILEESGYEAKATKLLAVYDRSRHDHPPHEFYVYKLFFLCELVGGEARPSNETLDVQWFAEDAIPPLSIGRVTPKQIARFYEHMRHPDFPTDFD